MTVLITSEDEWVITANNDTIYLRAFLDLRAGPIILVIPPMGDRQYWVPVSDMWHDFDPNLSWDTVGARGSAFALCPPGWQGLLPERVTRIDMGTPIIWTLPANAQELTRHDTRSGVLEFEANGYPTDETVRRIEEEIDYQLAVQAYIHFVPAVAMMQWRNAHFGPLGGKAGDLIVYRTTEQKMPIITANDTTTYVITWAELSDTDGFLMYEVPPGPTGGFEVAHRLRRACSVERMIRLLGARSSNHCSHRASSAGSGKHRDLPASAESPHHRASSAGAKSDEMRNFKDRGRGHRCLAAAGLGYRHGRPGSRPWRQVPDRAGGHRRPTWRSMHGLPTPTAARPMNWSCPGMCRC